MQVARLEQVKEGLPIVPIYRCFGKAMPQCADRWDYGDTI